MALRTSSANYDQNKDNLCVALLPYDLIFQMGKILSIYTSEEQVQGESINEGMILKYVNT